MKLIYNLILIVLMTFVFGQTNCAFSQTQNEIKPEKEVNSKIIPVKNFREKIKLNFPQKENQQTNKEKKEKRKSKINLVKNKTKFTKKQSMQKSPKMKMKRTRHQKKEAFLDEIKKIVIKNQKKKFQMLI